MQLGEMTTKYSLKNRQFHKKRLGIFDRSVGRSRSASRSRSISHSKSVSKKPQKQQKPTARQNDFQVSNNSPSLKVQEFGNESFNSREHSFADDYLNLSQIQEEQTSKQSQQISASFGKVTNLISDQNNSNLHSHDSGVENFSTQRVNSSNNAPNMNDSFGRGAHSSQYRQFNQSQNSNQRTQTLPIDPSSDHRVVGRHAILPSKPILFYRASGAASVNRVDMRMQSPLPFPEKVETQNARRNRFSSVIESRFSEENDSPEKKIVFEPIRRKSPTISSKSFSAERRSAVNLTILEPITSHQIQHSHPIRYGNSKQIVIEQIPRRFEEQHTLSQRSCHSLPKQLQGSRASNAMLTQSFRNATHVLPENQPQINFQAEEVKALRNRVQEQSLQIEYLKNQKHILETNIDLQYSPKKVGYQQEKKQTAIPENPSKKSGQKEAEAVSLSEQERSNMIFILETLQRNQEKLCHFQSRYQYIYRDISSQFRKCLDDCQQRLARIFAVKYQNFANSLKETLSEVDSRLRNLGGMEESLTVFNNTLRSVSESLRLTKLKQQNIELYVENKHKRSDRVWHEKTYNLDSQPSMRHVILNQSDISSIRRVDFGDSYDDLEDKEREYLAKLERNIQKRSNARDMKSSHSPEQQYRIVDEVLSESSISEINSSVDAMRSDERYSHLIYSRKPQQNAKLLQGGNQFTKNGFGSEIYQLSSEKKQKPQSCGKDLNKSTTSEELSQVSPFEANLMLEKTDRNLQPLPSNKDASFHYLKSDRRQSLRKADVSSSNDFQFQQHSFDHKYTFNKKDRINKDDELSFESNLTFIPRSTLEKVKNDSISENLQTEQTRVANLLQQKHCKTPIECWIDDMGCLRKKNQTYIFDAEGSVIMTTKAAFKKMREKRIIC